MFPFYPARQQIVRAVDFKLTHYPDAVRQARDLIEHARQLERENASLRERLAAAEKLLRFIANANVIFPSMCANNWDAYEIVRKLDEYKKAALDAEGKAT